MNITLEANPPDAPCCVKIIAEDGRDLLVQTDWDWPGIARTFGWSPSRVKDAELFPECEHQGSDGTVDCPTCGLKASRFIEAAREWIDDHDGDETEDPGYF